MKKIREIKKYYDIPNDVSPQARWIMNVMNEHDLDCTKLAKILRVKRQTIYNWIYDRNKIPFTSICAIVLLLDKHADQEKIYQIIYEGEQE